MNNKKREIIGIFFSKNDLKSIQISNVLVYGFKRLGLNVFSSPKVSDFSGLKLKFVISTSIHIPKPFPSFCYLFASFKREDLLSNESFNRNVFTYDAYLTCSKGVSKIITDLTSGITKKKPLIIQTRPLTPGFLVRSKKRGQFTFFSIVNRGTSTRSLKLLRAIKKKLGCVIVKDRIQSIDNLKRAYKKSISEDQTNIGLFLDDGSDTTSNDFYAAFSISQCDLVILNSNNSIRDLTDFHVNISNKSNEDIVDELEKIQSKIKRGYFKGSIKQKFERSSHELSAEFFIKRLLRDHDANWLNRRYDTSQNGRAIIGEPNNPSKTDETSKCHDKKKSDLIRTLNDRCQFSGWRAASRLLEIPFSLITSGRLNKSNFKLSIAHIKKNGIKAFLIKLLSLRIKP